MQATHDLITYTPFQLDDYDHFEYPGVVPRTFVGPVAIYAVMAPILSVGKMILKLPLWKYKFVLKLFARGILGMGLVFSLRKMRQAIAKEFGSSTAIWFGILNCVQFHLVFWGTRPLPNIFALILITYSCSFWVGRRNSSMPPSSSWALAEPDAIQREKLARGKKTDNEQPPVPVPVEPKLTLDQASLLTFATFTCVVFRSELVILLGPLAAMEIFVWKQMPLIPALQVCYTALSRSVALTVLVDSYFWRMNWFWPELRVFLFNTYQNKSHEWGVSPLYAYFTDFIPRIAPLTFPLAIASLFICQKQDRLKLMRYLLPMLCFVLLYSLLPHKEWRFIVYIVPILNMCAAYACHIITTWAFTTRHAHGLDKIRSVLLFIMLINSICATLGISVISLYSSSLNYPGAEAMARIHEKYPPTSFHHDFAYITQGPPRIHIDVYSAMNGISRFEQVGSSHGYIYSKDESHANRDDEMDYLTEANYTHLLVGDFRKMVIYTKMEEWNVLETVTGFDKVVFRYGSFTAWLQHARELVLKILLHQGMNDVDWIDLFPLDVVTRDKIWILERKDFHGEPIQHDQETLMS